MADNSVRSYLYDYDHLCRFGEERGLEAEGITIDDLRCLLAEINDLGVAPTTQRRFVAAWRLFFKMLVIGGDRKDNPADLLDLPLRPKHLPDVLTDEDITNIQSTFDLSTPEGYRNYVIVEMLYDCGLRVSELVGLRLSNLYVDEELIQVIGKGNKERWVPVGRRALELLGFYILEGSCCCRWYQKECQSSFVAPQFCHRAGGAWCRFACRAGDVGAREHSHYGDIHSLEPREFAGDDQLFPSALCQEDPIGLFCSPPSAVFFLPSLCSVIHRSILSLTFFPRLRRDP